MTLKNKSDRPQAAPGKLPDILDNKALLGNLMKGKTVVFAVDDGDHKLESVTLRYSVFDQAQVGEKSDVVTYSFLFSGVPLKADILICRSSAMFSRQPDALRKALEDFRKENPTAAVILCIYDNEVMRKVSDLRDTGVVNAIERIPPGDFELLLKAVSYLGTA